MRVLSVIPNYTDRSGGTTVSVSNFARALGSDVLSFTLESRIATARHGEGIFHIPVPDSPLGRQYSLPRACDIRKATQLAHNYDLIICHVLFRFHNGWVSRLGKPYFIVPHGSLDPYVFTYRRLQKEMWLLLSGARYFDRAEGVIFATRRERQKAWRGIGSDKSSVISWPVEGGRTEKSPDRAEVRKQLGITENEKMLLFLGRLDSMKRPLETIEAFAQAAQTNLHLVMVGPEFQYSVDELRRATTRLGARNVHVLGPVFGDAKWGFYNAADGYISLSLRENFGYSAAEALHAGLPLILSPGNDLGHELDGEGCSWQLMTNKREDAVRAIQAFGQAKPETLRQMGERGKRWVIANTSIECFRSKVRDLVLSQDTEEINRPLVSTSI